MKYRDMDLRADLVFIEVPAVNKLLPDQGTKRLITCIFRSDESDQTKKI